MSVYDVNGSTINLMYDADGNASSAVYDVNGNLLNGNVFSDETTITNVYTSSITSQPQGGCIDDDRNVYVCFYGAGKFLKHNISTETDTQVSFTPNAYGHANGMTYNPNTGYLYIASMNSTGEVYVFDKSFNLINTLYAKDANNTAFNCWNIAYDRNAERFITLSGGVIYFFDDAFNIITTGVYDANDWTDTRQDIETDGEYIYAVSYSSNKIHVFTMNGEFIKTITNTAFTGEPESLMYDWANDVFYIEGKSSGVYVIKSINFRS